MGNLDCNRDRDEDVESRLRWRQRGRWEIKTAMETERKMGNQEDNAERKMGNLDCNGDREEDGNQDCNRDREEDRKPRRQCREEDGESRLQ